MYYTIDYTYIYLLFYLFTIYYIIKNFVFFLKVSSFFFLTILRAFLAVIHL